MMHSLYIRLRLLCSEKLILVILVINMLCGPEALAEKRGKVIDFEDELVEGVNKRPYDSVSQIGERDRNRRKMHLYRKRQGFRTETQETLSELRMWQ